nr:hypothetical protein [Tanacetum cinerariifolium]
NALQTLLPQIRTEIREKFRTSSGPLDFVRNPPPVTIHTWLERFNKQKPPFPLTCWVPRSSCWYCKGAGKELPVADAARNYEILHERDDDDFERPDKRQKSGDRHQPTTQQSSHRNQGHNNDRHGSDMRGDAFKTRLAVYKFEGNALTWWKAYKQAKGGDAWLIT